MKKIVITGADGFVGKNLKAHLNQKTDDFEVITITKHDTDNEIIKAKLKDAHIIYHLAGINRPQHIEEFNDGNTGFTEKIIALLKENQENPTIVFSSSTQAALDNPYGISKKNAEDVLAKYAIEQNASVYIYRLCNVFGKWCKPNYNSAVATFCYNIARDLPITINNPTAEIELVYIDIVVENLLRHLEGENKVGANYETITTTSKISVQDLRDLISSFKKIRTTLILPDFSDILTKQLHSTYLSYLTEDDFAYDLLERQDNRGTLVELFKSEKLGQVFVSTTHPGITRGNHFHHTKVEKFIVIKGEASIRFRKIDESDVLEYKVSGSKIQVVDIPVGYTHHIENIGNEEMVVMFWANEIFEQERTDTYFLGV